MPTTRSQARKAAVIVSLNEDIEVLKGTFGALDKEGRY